MTSDSARDLIVTVLRCAADERPAGGLNGMFGAVTDLGVSRNIEALSWSALEWARRNGVERYRPRAWSLYPVDEAYRAELLETALLVEEGSWP